MRFGVGLPRQRAAEACLCAVLVAGVAGCSRPPAEPSYPHPCDPATEWVAVPPPADAPVCGDGVAAEHTRFCQRGHGYGCGIERTTGTECCWTIEEACDGEDLRDQSCESLGFAGGELRCDGCVLDPSRCRRCISSDSLRCGSLEVEGGDGFLVASFGNTTLVYWGGRFYEVSADLELTERFEIADVSDMAPCADGIVIAHRDGDETLLSTWRGGAEVERGAATLPIATSMWLVPVRERDGSLLAVSDRSAFLLDRRGRPRPLPSKAVLTATNQGTRHFVVPLRDGIELDGEPVTYELPESASVGLEHLFVSVRPSGAIDLNVGGFGVRTARAPATIVVGPHSLTVDPAEVSEPETEARGEEDPFGLLRRDEALLRLSREAGLDGSVYRIARRAPHGMESSSLLCSSRRRDGTLWVARTHLFSEVDPGPEPHRDPYRLPPEDEHAFLGHGACEALPSPPVRWSSHIELALVAP